MRPNPFRRVALGLSLLLAAPAFGAESHLLGGVQADPFFINDVVGTNVLWDAGYFGAGVVIANVEAGHPWSGHEVFDRTALGIPSTPGRLVNEPATPDAPELGEFDFHATMVAHVLVGAKTVVNPDTSVSLTLAGAGMAPLATLWSGAIATRFDKTLDNLGSFEISDASFRTPYVAFYEGGPQGRADVINSSWGFTDPSARERETRIITGLAAQNPSVATVFSAGNSGPGPDTVGGPGSSFNVITVGALGGPEWLTPSDFSSSGPVAFYHPATDTVVPAARAAVHLAAPGENFALAAYLQPTGGLEPALGGFVTAANNLYFTFSQSGTSFSAPVVAGGVGLLKELIRTGPYALPQTEALDTRVIRSVLMASATRTEGWDNGQIAGPGGALVTTQALDYRTGAGRIDLGSAAFVTVFGTTDVPGLGGGTGLDSLGWDFGRIDLGQGNDYTLDPFGAAEAFEFTAALNWFVADTFDSITGVTTHGSFANLELEVWSVSFAGTFTTLRAASRSAYNTAEFLRFTVGPGERLGLRVRFDAAVYDLDGTPGGAVDYGLAWATTAIPEPAAGAAWAGLVCGFAGLARRRRRR
jgi:hypothetical protein